MMKVPTDGRARSWRPPLLWRNAVWNRGTDQIRRRGTIGNESALSRLHAQRTALVVQADTSHSDVELQSPAGNRHELTGFHVGLAMGVVVRKRLPAALPIAPVKKRAPPR